MGIEVRPVDGLVCPTIICDSCGEPIRDGNGIAVHDGWDPETETYDGRPRFFHKTDRGGPAPCQTGPADRYANWEDLDVFLFYLLNGVGVKITKDVKERAQGLALL